MSAKEKLQQLIRIAIRQGSTLYRLNDAAIDEARELLEANPNLSISEVLQRVDDITLPIYPRI